MPKLLLSLLIDLRDDDGWSREVDGGSHLSPFPPGGVYGLDEAGRGLGHARDGVRRLHEVAIPLAHHCPQFLAFGVDFAVNGLR